MEKKGMLPTINPSLTIKSNRVIPSVGAPVSGFDLNISTIVFPAHRNPRNISSRNRKTTVSNFEKYTMTIIANAYVRNALGHVCHSIKFPERIIVKQRAATDQ